MNLIASADQYWGIGKNGKLLINIPEDMKRFRKMTTGHAVILGRKTLETFPQGKPLRDRLNVILTRNPEFQAEGATVVHSVEEAKKAVSSYDDEDVYIIGGESIYQLFLPDCKMAYITRLDYSYEADAHLPALDHDPAWKLIEESEEQTYFDVIYHFDTYQRVKG